ncbi:alpha/beta fold hydrolase [Ramlibacter sp. MMS24-I3-19]|uniref:alpha/beta fold hydrolase n=1 Tax=Ramlibacter sp. MMS24-I3-19 TaxID=3416606 RepID=UPI003D03DF87
MTFLLDKTRLPPWAPLAAAAAVAALGTAVWVQHEADRAEHRHPAPGKFIHIDGVRLHYRIAGDGPAVLLIHGNTVHGNDFEASGLLRRLSRNHRLLVIDRPGFGWSDRTRDRTWTPAEQARLLCRAAVALGFENFAVVGHSLGTQVAIAMALGDPAHVNRLVLVGGYYFPSLRLDVVSASLGAIPWFGDAMRYTVASLAARLALGPTVKALFAPQPVPPAFGEALPRELLLRPLQQRATTEDGAHMVTQARVLKPHYAELKVPITLVAGAQDAIVDSRSQSGRLHHVLPHSRLHILDGVGHMAHYHAQELIASALAAPQPG